MWVLKVVVCPCLMFNVLTSLLTQLSILGYNISMSAIDVHSEIFVTIMSETYRPDGYSLIQERPSSLVRSQLVKEQSILSNNQTYHTLLQLSVAPIMLQLIILTLNYDHHIIAFCHSNTHHGDGVL